MCHFFLSISNFFYFHDPLSNLPQNTVRRCLKSLCRNRSESLCQCRCLKYLCSKRSKSLRCFLKSMAVSRCFQVKVSHLLHN
ncbi:hypothetical protein HanRHA438_Chr07g0304281 [Helianthus annuus]|uniref:Uncharacterized protein n=1 Tax=Helianthus annuus TaxID=4232 RepID=A0A251TSC9_HELAN|nr:hypothetical protein HanXRQr2_Chr07g0293991 [Helianthus annuus]KAJ0550112.1 hypothetical protein HanHA300_Chr07g0241691 [Helianthus annuus]KAJ0556721.1 hypothetical protein HanIR_Chr07g0317051 [Helianthus annuus]KAJ0563065.1 hypothetical protein HanHA89_Chr07g0258871 [Helianthus annuus]KAJ0728436.1 hypothetical protein HanLR1_Chr07g0241581 [Helianthus annuus]